jgi:hypothetical protein
MPPSPTRSVRVAIRESRVPENSMDASEVARAGLVKRRCLTAVRVEVDGATPCAKDAGGVAAAQDAPGKNAQHMGSLLHKRFTLDGLARPDSNPITLWIVINEETHLYIRAVVGVRGEPGRKPLTVLSCRKCHPRYLGTFFAGGWLALRHLDVLVEVQRESRCREPDTGHAGTGDHCRHSHTFLSEGSSTLFADLSLSDARPPERGWKSGFSLTFL